MLDTNILIYLIKNKPESVTQRVNALGDPSGAGLCEHFAEQSVRLKAAGTPIGSNDLWIACHALAEAAVLVTNNEAEFTRVSGLRVENWA